MVEFSISTLIFLLLQLPLMLLSFVVVPFLLSTKWVGKTTWFGNLKHGRGKTHYSYPATTFWRQWWFLCIRNPVSNFGKQVLSVKDAPWVWLEDKQVFKTLHWKYGWKDQTTETPRRTFVYRPWLHQPIPKP